MAADRGAERPPTGGARPGASRGAPTGRRPQSRSEQTGRRDQVRRTADPSRTRGGDRRNDKDGPGRRPPPPGAAPDRPDREPARPGLARSENEPRLPDDIDTRTLHRSVRAELRSLPKDLAEIVAGHLVLAGQLVDEEPDLAYAHAEAARRRAARLPIVREAAAETAYAAGKFDVALSEFRALRRMTGADDFLPVMADCERALGRPQNALKLAKESARRPLELPSRVEMTIVEAGARADLGQHAEAQRILERAQPGQLPTPDLAGAYARLRYAYADVLLRADRTVEARDWFVRAAELDPDQQTDAQQRVDDLDGFVIELDQSDDAG